MSIRAPSWLYLTPLPTKDANSSSGGIRTQILRITGMRFDNSSKLGVQDGIVGGPDDNPGNGALQLGPEGSGGQPCSTLPGVSQAWKPTQSQGQALGPSPRVRRGRKGLGSLNLKRGRSTVIVPDSSLQGL